MRRPELQKIYYVPGIISLTLLPLLFIHFSRQVLKTNSIGVIPLVIADTLPPRQQLLDALKEYKGSFPPKRNYTDILLTGDRNTDQVKLDFARIRIREIISANDSINGLHFQFSDSSEYWTFVKAIDILRIEGASTYMPYNNDLWFYHFPPDTTDLSWTCGTPYYTKVIYKTPNRSWWTKAIDGITKSWNRSWLLIVTFLGFVASVLILRRQKNGR